MRLALIDLNAVLIGERPLAAINLSRFGLVRRLSDAMRGVWPMGSLA
jgi:hypothetical protein